MGIFKAPKITTSDRTSLVLDDGEIVYDTDLQKFFKGDGTTSGGISMEGAAWGGITGTLSAQSDLNTALGNKENTIASGTTGQYWRGDKSWQTLDKSAVGLGNVPNLDTSNPANITQNSTHRFVTDTEKSTWNGKQDALGYTPANRAGDTFTGSISATNLSGTNTGDETASTIRTKIGAASASNDGYLSQSDWSTFNNKQSSLGFAPEDVANKSTNTSLGTSNTLYPTQNAVKSYVDTGLSGKQNSLGYTAEDSANKENVTINTDTTKYPTVNLLKTGLDAKQDSLVSGTNIKTVNGNSLLGTGDLTITGGLSQQQIEGLI